MLVVAEYSSSSSLVSLISGGMVTSSPSLTPSSITISSCASFSPPSSFLSFLFGFGEEVLALVAEVVLVVGAGTGLLGLGFVFALVLVLASAGMMVGGTSLVELVALALDLDLEVAALAGISALALVAAGLEPEVEAVLEGMVVWLKITC